jgi:hypothetical protein
MARNAPHSNADGIRLSDDTSDDPQSLAHSLRTSAGMGLRDAMVARFGIGSSKQLCTADSPGLRERVYTVQIYTRSAHEVILGENDSHRLLIEFT